MSKMSIKERAADGDGLRWVGHSSSITAEGAGAADLAVSCWWLVRETKSRSV